VVEVRWFTLTAGGGRWAIPQDAVWLLSGPVAVNPLPGARPWCIGWILLRDQLVPVFGGGPFAGLREPRVFLALRKGGALLALPSESADLVGGDLGAVGPEECPLPVAGAVDCGSGPPALVLDVERLYRGLGLPIESTAEDRG